MRRTPLRATPRRLTRWRASLLLGLWIIGGLLALRALWSVGGTRLAPPPLDPHVWPQWWTGRDPLDAVAGVMRVVTMGAVGYLVLVAVAHGGACLWGHAGLQRRTARLNPRFVTALAAVAALGSGPAVGATSGPASPGSPTGGGATMTLVESGATADDGAGRSGEGATMTLLDDRGADPGRASPVSAATVPSGPLTVTVRPGDHFWSIAERSVALAVGAPPTEEQVRTYWVALVEANRDRLVDPDNADLILPGQELVLPG